VTAVAATAVAVTAVAFVTAVVVGPDELLYVYVHIHA